VNDWDRHVELDIALGLPLTSVPHDWRRPHPFFDCLLSPVIRSEILSPEGYLRSTAYMPIVRRTPCGGYMDLADAMTEDIRRRIHK